MRQRTHQRLSLLRVAAVLVTMAWLYVGTGCDGTPPDGPPPPTPTATPTPSDRVRRRSAGAKAGSPRSNPPPLTDANWKDLKKDDGIWTDGSGEAELDLDGCSGNVYVFDSSKLSVWTCTKQAEAEKEYWCTEEGTAGFNIDCAARFIVVDTPSALVTIQGTAFSITYLPDDQLTLVTVLRGVVEVAPVVDMVSLKLGDPVTVKEDFFLYTMPGEVSPEVGTIPAREPRPLNELPIIVDNLGIQGTIDNITRWGGGQQILPPSWPRPEQVALAFDGGQLTDPRVQQAFVSAIDQEAIIGRAFLDQDVQFTARIGDDLLDAYTIPYNPEKAYALLEEAGYDPGEMVTVLFPEEDDQVAMAAKLIAGDLSRIDIPVELTPVPQKDLSTIMKKLSSAEQPVVAVYTPGPLSCMVEAVGEFAALWQSYRFQLGCPLYPAPKVIQDAEQVFDNGKMLWREDEQYIYIIYEKGERAGTYEFFLDEWKENDPEYPEYSCAATPPPDRLQPKRGFGLVWCKLGGPEAAIGWALEEEAGFEEGDGDPLVQDFGSGVIFRDSAGGESGMAYALFSSTETFVQEDY